MAYSHWKEPRTGQGQGTNGLYETIEALTLHLNQDSSQDLLSLIVLVPVPVPVSFPVPLSVNTPSCVSEDMYSW